MGMTTSFVHCSKSDYILTTFWIKAVNVMRLTTLVTTFMTTFCFQCNSYIEAKSVNKPGTIINSIVNPVHCKKDCSTQLVCDKFIWQTWHRFIGHKKRVRLGNTKHQGNSVQTWPFSEAAIAAYIRGNQKAIFSSHPQVIQEGNQISWSKFPKYT